MNSEDPEHPLYQLESVYKDGVYGQLIVNLPVEGNQERSARAKLITAMFDKAESLGIDVSRLRFHV